MIRACVGISVALPAVGLLPLERNALREWGVWTGAGHLKQTPKSMTEQSCVLAGCVAFRWNALGSAARVDRSHGYEEALPGNPGSALVQLT